MFRSFWSLPSKGTKKVYKYGLNKFLNWTGKTADQVLQERKDDLTQRPNEDIVTYRNRASNYERIIESFYNDLIKEGYKINAAKSITHGIRQLFRYYHMDIKMRTGSNVNRTIKTQRNFPLTIELDSLMFGGIPENYAVVLTGSPSDERDYLINNFLNAGIKEDEIVFYVSTEADGLENFLENPNFVLFLCNPKPKTKVPDLPNVYKLRSKTDLTNLSISLAKAYRNVETSKKKRICVETVSNVLLDYEAKATSKWISEFITDLEAKRFTILAIMDPEMHPPDQSKAVSNLFDGEISITQSDDPIDYKKSILVKKLRNQDYIKNPICLSKNNNN